MPGAGVGCGTSDVRSRSRPKKLRLRNTALKEVKLSSLFFKTVFLSLFVYTFFCGAGRMNRSQSRLKLAPQHWLALSKNKQNDENEMFDEPW